MQLEPVVIDDVGNQVINTLARRLAPIPQLQVFWGVVKAIAIFVVYVFTRK